jgi:hypothetical protein
MDRGEDTFLMSEENDMDPGEIPVYLFFLRLRKC